MKLLLLALFAINSVNLAFSYEGDEAYDEAPVVDSQEEVYPTQLPSAISTIAPTEEYPQPSDEVSPYPRNDDTEESSYDDY